MRCGLCLKFVDERLVDDNLDSAVQNTKFYWAATEHLAIYLEVYLGRRLYAYLTALKVLDMTDRVDLAIKEAT